MNKLMNIKLKYKKEILYIVISLSTAVLGFLVDLITVFTLKDSTGYFPVFMLFGMFSSIIIGIFMFNYYIWKKDLEFPVKIIFSLVSPLAVPNIIVAAIIILFLGFYPGIIYLIFKAIIYIFKSIFR